MTYICMCVCIYIYIYIERERERERIYKAVKTEISTDKPLISFLTVCVYIYVCI